MPVQEKGASLVCNGFLFLGQICLFVWHRIYDVLLLTNCIWFELSKKRMVSYSSIVGIFGPGILLEQLNFVSTRSCSQDY